VESPIHSGGVLPISEGERGGQGRGDLTESLRVQNRRQGAGMLNTPLTLPLESERRLNGIFHFSALT
jgi:hypothetical protein